MSYQKNLFDARQRIGSLKSWTSLLGRPHYTLSKSLISRISFASYDSIIDSRFAQIRKIAEKDFTRFFSAYPQALDYFDNQLSRMNVIVGVLQTIPAGAKGLDIGIASGYHSIVLKEFYGHVIEGLDSQNGIDLYGAFPLSKGISITPWAIGSQAIPIIKESFDYAIFAEVLEHLKTSPELVLREIVASLREGGLLILSTPNFGRFDNIWRLTRGLNIVARYPSDLALGSDATDHIEHVREYTIPEVVELLESASMEVQHILMCNKHRRCDVPAPYLEETMCVVARKKK